MMDDQVRAHLKTLGDRKQVVLYGMETHVCVRQTALDLLEDDFDVHLVVDAVSSINLHDRNTAIEFLRDVGVVLRTYESLTNELEEREKCNNTKEL